MKHFLPALRMLTFMTILTGLVYPLLVTGIAKVIFPHQANGSFILKDGKSVGSELIGQNFEKPGYFWSRPSAVSYNPLPSGGSNWGMISTDLKKLVDERAAKLKDANGSADPIPQDLLFASGSGLDPHMSPEAAQYQVARVAKARGLAIDRIQDLVKTTTEGPQYGLLGESRVNVLRLNLALDQVGGANE